MTTKKSILGSNLLSTKMQEGRAVAGVKKVLKQLRAGKLSQVFLASNCPAQMKKDVESSARLAKVPVVELAVNNEELGVLCKKNFFISVAGIKEG